MVCQRAVVIAVALLVVASHGRWAHNEAGVRGRWRTNVYAAAVGTGGPHRLLGDGRLRRLALSHGDPRERRHRRSAAQRGGAPHCGEWDQSGMRRPVRVPRMRRSRADASAGTAHITWQDDRTLKIESDAGTQTRLLYFTPPQNQGAADHAQALPAAWDGVQGGRGAGAPRWASLRVVTNQLRAGYLRKNGVPYSENAVLTEYFDLHPGPGGSTWITLTAIVNDPKYLGQEFITSTDFRKEPDGSKWNPTPCGAD